MQRGSRQSECSALAPKFIAESATGCRHGAFPFGGLLVNFLPDFLPCAPPLGLGRLGVTAAPRRAPASGVLARLPAASLISRSLISSHWASVRWRSGIARSCCRRSWGEIGCGAFMLALSHRSTWRQRQASLCLPHGASKLFMSRKQPVIIPPPLYIRAELSRKQDERLASWPRAAVDPLLPVVP